ncbi:hypothetical protein ABMA28_000449 [Loxostege sticticalis]|uniref:Reverse transcriptase domain-containing protein n=1 Tax=Loxostege sticticalis TaxID=481309 RepID=A0ABD0TSR2_LOXSC
MLPRFFKGQRGLKIHLTRIHQSITNNVQDIIQASSTQPLITLSVPFHHKRSRLVALALSSSITKVVSENTLEAWEHLFTFSYRILHISSDPNNHLSSTQRIKQNCSDNLNSSAPTCYFVFARAVDGGIKGAAHLLFSNDVFALDNPETLSALLFKHPLPSPTLRLPDPPHQSYPSPIVTSNDIQAALFSFKKGSAGGLDGLSPQHLKDLVSSDARDAASSLLASLTSLVNLMLSGANLIALNKKDGGIRPIVIGSTFRRLTSKICVRQLYSNISRMLQPHQLGFGLKGGCEAAVHAAHTFLHHNGADVCRR